MPDRPPGEVGKEPTVDLSRSSGAAAPDSHLCFYQYRCSPFMFELTGFFTCNIYWKGPSTTYLIVGMGKSRALEGSERAWGHTAWWESIKMPNRRQWMGAIPSEGRWIFNHESLPVSLILWSDVLEHFHKEVIFSSRSRVLSRTGIHSPVLPPIYKKELGTP